MTIGDYIKEKLSLWSVGYSDAQINVELLKLGLSASDTVTASTNLDLFFYNVIPDFLSMASSVSEGGMSISFDKGALQAYYAMIASRLGKPNAISNNRIKDITNRW